MNELQERFRAAAEACDDTVVWHAQRGPAETMRLLADAAEELGIDEWDRYGEGGAVERLEAEVAELLGKPAAVFFVSGIMAQQAALRVWCERRRSQRVAIPDLSHQLRHETDGPRLLQGFRFETLTEGWETATAESLRAIPGHRDLGAVQLELPLREAGCLLPTWEELTAFSEAARELGVPFHVDGARLWESQPFFDQPSRRSPRSSTASTSPSTRGSGRWPAPRSPATRTSPRSCAPGGSGWAGRCSG